MSKEDIARVALGAPALHEVFIVSTPDCLLVRSWARAGRSNAEDAATHLGNLFRVSQEMISVVGSSATPTIVTVESDDRVVLLANVSSDMVAGFVFDKSAPLGLVRVQSRQLADHIRASVNQLHEPSELGFGTEPKLEPRVTPPVESHVRPSFEPPIPRAPVVVRKALHDTQRLTLTPEPPRRFPEPAVTLNSPPPQPLPGGPTKPPPTRPRAVRLLEFYKRYAPDPHAALLRLSLRTGITVDRLERPDDLEEAQVEVVAAAVRDILGQEQVGI